VDAQGDSDNRIGGYDLRLRQKSRCIWLWQQRETDHIALYSFGIGAFWILCSDNGTFSSVYQ
jgi:hypothetical protein